MAFSCFRLFRALKSMCAPITAVIGFSCLLTFIFILYQPTPGPGDIQRLGWQSWAVITTSDDAHNAASSTNTSIGGSISEDIPEGVDWWNVTSPGEKFDSSNLPLDVWAPLLPHDTGCASCNTLFIRVNGVNFVIMQ